MVTLYRENRVDQEWEVGVQEVSRQFWKAVENGHPALGGVLESRGLTAALTVFITGPGPSCLNSTWDKSDEDDNGLPGGLYAEARAQWPEPAQ